MRDFIIILGSVSVLFFASLTSAQELPSRTVEFVPGHTDICNRLTASEIQCTRFKKGEKTQTFTCKQDKTRQGESNQNKKGKFTCSVEN